MGKRHFQGIILLLLAVFLHHAGNAQILTASPTALFFPATAPASTSAALATVVTGSFLSPSSGSLTIASSGPSDFRAFDPTTSSWVSSFTINYSGGVLSATSIWVQFTPSAVTSYSASLLVFGGGATTVTVPLNGFGASICSGTPSAGVITFSSPVACGSATVNLLDSGSSYSTVGGVSLQWQSSPDSSTWTDISGATAAAYSTSISTSTYYRTRVYCSVSGIAAYSAGRLLVFSSTCPTLTASPPSISFGAIAPSSTSAPVASAITGIYLTPSSGLLTVTAPSNFSICSTSSGSYVSSYTISYSGGSVSSTSVFVKFIAPSTTGAYSGNVRISGGGTLVLIPVNGASSTACAGTPSAGTSASSVDTATTTTPITLTNSGHSASSGITFQWQTSPTSSSWANITGATNTTCSFTGITANTYYRCMVTCTVSSASVSTSAILITYVAPCSGTPAGGTAAATTASCMSCRDTLSVSGGTSGPDIAYQWEQSPDGSTGWITIAGATATTHIFTVTGDYYYRCARTCYSSGLTGRSSPVHVAFPYGISVHTRVDSASITCAGPLFSVMANGNSPLLYVVTRYGDGQQDSIHASGSPRGVASVHHLYRHSGTYTVQHKLYFNGVLQDSVSYPYSYIYCRTLPVAFFLDLDSDCNFTSTDRAIYHPISMEVDSNGTVVDTVTATSGFYYPTNAPAGTVYTFRLLTAMPGLNVTCPTSGIVRDTLDSMVNVNQARYLGFACSSASGFDLLGHYSMPCRTNEVEGDIYVENLSCNPQTATVRLTLPTRFTYQSGSISPSLVTGNVVEWTLGCLSLSTRPMYIIHYVAWSASSSSSYSVRDTVHTNLVVTPTSGDWDASNNTETRVDTVRASWDPNYIESNPSGHIASGITLRYTVGFENYGNDTAHNIHVLDTLSDYLDASTLKPVFASHAMYIEKRKVGGQTIVKFDFPNIKLLDSSHHGFSQGTFQYDIKVKNGLPDCTYIPARVGIYFDDNEVVMTNTHTNVIGCWPSAVGSPDSYRESAIGSLTVYPNPASDVLNIETTAGAFQNYSVTNSMGSVVMNGSADGAHTKLHIKNLSAGIYCIRLMGEQGVEVRKFVKE